MVTEVGSERRPLRVGIIGSGPSGFYAAEALLATSYQVEVDIFERLPAPYGLVRYGVAPDHPKIKNVVRIYERIASDPRVHFWGNVHVGKMISIEQLQNFYDALIFACGTQADRKLNIPGEELTGSHTATEFVAWYNGHPDYRHRVFDLSQEVAVVIGLGNVAMDVCRILSKTVDELRQTDIAAHALEVLAESKIREVHLVGRRGPVQAAFTPPELREFGALAASEPIVSAEDLELNASSQKEIEDLTVPKRRKNYDLLRQFAANPGTGKPRRLIMHFCQSPRELRGGSAVEEVDLERNILSGPPGGQKAKGSGKTTTIPCGLFFRSVGYRGTALAGVPFDERRGIFANVEGRLVERDRHLPGMYAVGWIKRGPSGVIGTNKPDSVETVRHLLSDMPDLPPARYPDVADVRSFLEQQGVRVVDFEEWKKIDQAEIERGKSRGKPREKFVDIADMLSVASVSNSC